MKADLRFLMALNAALIGIAILAIAKLVALTPPQQDFTADIKWLNQAPSVSAAVESAGTIAKKAMRRGETIKKERKLSAILGGFAGFVGATNLFYMIWLYRKMKAGVYLQDGVELQKT
jgi:hypothetical protein